MVFKENLLKNFLNLGLLELSNQAKMQFELLLRERPELRPFLELPEVQAMKGQPQNKWHAYDVYQHTMNVVNVLFRRAVSLELLVAGLLHDIGKPFTATPDKDSYGNIMYVNGHASYSFKGHEDAGAELIEKLPNKLFAACSSSKNKIAEITKYHWLSKNLRKTKSFEEFRYCCSLLRAQLDNGLAPIKQDLLELFYADSAGKGTSALQLQFAFGVYSMFSKNAFDEIKALYQIVNKTQKCLKGGKNEN